MTKLLLLSMAFLLNILFTVAANNLSLYRAKRQEYSDDPEIDQLGIFVGTVVSEKNESLPAIIVSGISAVTSADIGSSWATQKLCPGLSQKHKKCLDIHDCKIDGDLAYIKVPIMASFTKEIQALVNKGAIQTSTCTAVCYMHNILKVKYLSDSNEVQCNRCNFLDALFCDFQIIGALGKSKDGKFPILRYTGLQAHALQTMGDDQSTEVWETFKRRTNTVVGTATTWLSCKRIIVGALMLIILSKFAMKHVV